MRYGFTTGSCAAAAAKAAAYMLLTGKEKKNISIETPKGIVYTPEIIDIVRGEREVSCGVVKDGGDDPDITNGTKICARAILPRKDWENSGQGDAIQPAYAEEERKGCGTSDVMQPACAETEGKGSGSVDRKTECEMVAAVQTVCMETECGYACVIIDGGVGVGRVTRPGLDQPVGNAAINHVPREMIEREVQQVCQVCDYRGKIQITIFVPQGEALAEKTFNPRLGIVGGISILGTSGIVEPMSEKALLETIRVELRQRRTEGAEIIAVSPGNYGLEYMKRTYGYDLNQSVKCSNFIGDTIDMAAELGYQKMLLTGHIGKLIKLAGGIMNTHSREGDCRMELLTAAALRQGMPTDCLRAILGSLTTEEALGKLPDDRSRDVVMQDVMEHIAFYLDKRAAGRIQDK